MDFCLERRIIRHSPTFALLLLLLASALPAQERVVAGVVQDENGRPIAGATVAVAGRFGATESRLDGSFVLHVPGMSAMVSVRRLGFEPVELLFDLTGDTVRAPVVIRLVPLPTLLMGVMVPGERTAPFGQTVTRVTVRNVPPLGEPDVLRALPLLPGVTQPNDLLGRLHLAGAAGDETAITLDGHPMQAPSHLSGIVGGFNVAAIDRVEVLAHHVPAARDARLGGVVELHSRERAQRGSGELVGTLLASSLTLSEPSLLGRVDVLASGRMTYLDRLLRRVYGTARSASDPVPSYGDALVRLEAPLDGSWSIQGVGYFSRDWTDAGLTPGTRALALGEVLGGVSLTRLGALSRVSLRLSESVGSSSARSASGAPDRDLDIRQRWRSAELVVERGVSRRLNGTLSVAADWKAHAHQWELGQLQEFPALPMNFRANQVQSRFATGIEVALAPGRAWGASVGARTSVVEGRAFVAPRIQVSRQLTGSIQLLAAYDRRHQFDAQFGEPEEGRVTAPVFLLRDPRRADAFAATAELVGLRGRGRSLALSLTAFSRHYAARTRAVRSEPDTAFATGVRFERTAARSAGLASGVTFATEAGLALQASYTYTRARERRSGSWVPSDWETPHTVAALLAIPLPRRWTLAAALQVHSGTPVTPVLTQVLVPSAVFPGRYTQRLVFGEPNAARLPSFQRLDFSLRRVWRPRSLEVALSVQAVNVLARENVLAYDWYRLVTQASSGGSSPSSRSGSPFVPSIGVEVRW